MGKLSLPIDTLDAYAYTDNYIRDGIRATYKNPEDVVAGLAQSMVEEQTAFEWYIRRAITAKEWGDMETYELYMHIADEEDAHKNELAARVAKLRTSIMVATE